MGDKEFLEKIAKYWIELGGDAAGVGWCRQELKDTIAALQDDK